MRDTNHRRLPAILATAGAAILLLGLALPCLRLSIFWSSPKEPSGFELIPQAWSALSQALSNRPANTSTILLFLAFIVPPIPALLGLVSGISSLRGSGEDIPSRLWKLTIVSSVVVMFAFLDVFQQLGNLGGVASSRLGTGFWISLVGNGVLLAFAFATMRARPDVMPAEATRSQ